jgi:hypothetical protein
VADKKVWKCESKNSTIWLFTALSKILDIMGRILTGW